VVDMGNLNIVMKKVNPQIIDHGFSKAPNEWGNGKVQWYKTIIPQTFRGTYTLYLCEGDICGTFQGMSIQDHDFDSLMDKLSFKTPEAVKWTIDLLNSLKENGVIEFDIA
jgi:hypothetical protein